jgi:hypothetical protein
MPGVFQSNIFQNEIFQGPHGPAVTYTSTGQGGPGTKVFWPKRKYFELQAELEQEKVLAAQEKARRAALSPLQRIDEDIAAADAVLKVTDFSDKYFQAQKQRAALLKERPAAERHQTIVDLSEKIKAERRARVAAIKAKAGLK